jgi:gluconokinase
VIVIVMGVTGSGKTTVGRAVAARLGWAFHDADEYHPDENVARMRSGVPLTDEDRRPWLRRLQELTTRHAREGTDAVLACSALRQRYRERLLPAVPEPHRLVRFFYLRVGRELAADRVSRRRDHFMAATLVQSQFDALEEPLDALVIDAALPVPALVEAIVAALGEASDPALAPVT